MAKKINENDLKNYIDGQSLKILDVSQLELLGDGKYQNLHYCQQIANNSESIGRVCSSETNHSAYEEYVRMYLLTKLCNELGYDARHIEVERRFESGSRSSNNDFLDICVYDEQDPNSIYMMIELKKPESYESSLDESIQNQLYKLFGMAQQENPAKNVKYLVYYTVETINHSFKERCIIIDTQQCPTFEDYINFNAQGITFENSIPSNYGIVNSVRYGNVETPTETLRPLPLIIDSKISQTLATNLHSLLWGGGSVSDNKIFVSLTNIMLVKIFDEENTGGNQEYSFQIKTQRDTSRNNEIAESDESLYKRLDELYKKASKQKLFIDETDRHIVEEDLKGKLKQVVNLLQPYDFKKTTENTVGVDILGQFFETIIGTGFKQDKGQFFTPIEIVRFIINGLKIDELVENKFLNNNDLPYAIDPCCGSGTFLIEYMKYVTKYLEKYSVNRSTNNLSRNKNDLLQKWVGDGGKNYWARTYIYGSDISSDLGTAVKVNMVMHGDGASNIFCGNKKGDGLLSFLTYKKPEGEESKLMVSSMSQYYPHEVNEMFDIVISNPPFSVLLNSETIERVENNFELKYKGGKTKNSENIFVERFYQLLKPLGRMGIVLPESCFDGTADSIELRMFLFKYFNVRAIVSLPITTFEPFTTTKVSLVFAQKKKHSEIKKWNDDYNQYVEQGLELEDIYIKLVDKYNCDVKMIQVDNVGYKKTKAAAPLSKPNDLFNKEDSENIIFKDIDNEQYAIYDLRKIEWEE